MAKSARSNRHWFEMKAGVVRGFVLRQDSAAWVVIASFVFAYSTVFHDLVLHWISNDIYYHVVVIPFISAYLIWLRRSRLCDTPIEPNYLMGGMLLIAGMAVLAAGYRTGFKIIQQVSLAATIPGMVLLFFGYKFLYRLAFPISYLLLMLPIWVDGFTHFYYPFQLLTTDIATVMLHLFSVPAFHDGIYIQLPKITLEVAKECSGIRYLIAVTTLCLPVGYLYVGGVRRQMALLSFAIVVALLGNAIRVALIGVFSYYDLSDTTHGPAHIFQGLFVSIVGYLAIGIGLLLFRKKTSESDTEMRIVNLSAPVQSKMRAPCPLSLAICVSALFVIMGLGSGSLHRNIHKFAVDLEQFPRKIRTWELMEVLQGDEVLSGPSTERQLTRRYRGPSNEVVDLHVGVYDSHVEMGRLDFEKKVGYYDKISRETILFPGEESMVVNKGYKHGNLGSLVTYSWLSVNGSVWLSPSHAKLHAFWRNLLQESGEIVFVLIRVRYDMAMSVDQEPAVALKAFVREVSRGVTPVYDGSGRGRQDNSGAL